MLMLLFYFCKLIFFLNFVAIFNETVTRYVKHYTLVAGLEYIMYLNI